MGDEEDRQALEELARLGAEVVAKKLDLDAKDPDCPVLFAVMMFTRGEGGWSSYASNAQPEDMIDALREMADSLEKRRRH